MTKEPSICVVGLGYVGLPLAAAFGKTGWKTYGFDISQKRVEALKQNEDWTRELTSDDLKNTTIEYSADPAIVKSANTIVVAVPTPINEKNDPDLTLVEKASEMIGNNMSKGTVVVYESTVYPGVTEDICVPILEKASGLKNGTDFTVGYSPERINPGDKEHTIDKIVKVVAGQDDATTEWLAMVYGKIVIAGIYKAANIKTAELAKALENTQRDINIALMNEIARFCDLLGIRTKDVLDAAGTKWNFLRFTPGLVGGHCIGVDPYYLVKKADDLGLKTDVILAGRKINDSQAAFISKKIIDTMKAKKIDAKTAKILVLGLTFKENVPDMRNAKIHDVIRQLHANGAEIYGSDPFLQADEIRSIGITEAELSTQTYDVIVYAVPHDQYKKISASDFVSHMNPHGIFYDVRSMLNPENFGTVTYLSL